MIEEISAFVFYCTPTFPRGIGSDKPIRSMEIIIYAKDREEADMIFNHQAYKFFEQDLTISVRVMAQGYRNEQRTNNKAGETGK